MRKEAVKHRIAEIEECIFGLINDLATKHEGVRRTILGLRELGLTLRLIHAFSYAMMEQQRNRRFYKFDASVLFIKLAVENHSRYPVAKGLIDAFRFEEPEFDIDLFVLKVPDELTTSSLKVPEFSHQDLEFLARIEKGKLHYSSRDLEFLKRLVILDD